MRGLWLLAFVAFAASAHESDVRFEQRAGANVPAELLGGYLGRSPVVLVLGYNSCVNLCATTLEGTSQALTATGLAPERDYTALFVSIDPRDEKTAPRRTSAAAPARFASST